MTRIQPTTVNQENIWRFDDWSHQLPSCHNVILQTECPWFVHSPEHFFARHDFHPKRADRLEWLKQNDMVCCVCLGLFPVDWMRLQKFNGWIVANVCKTYGNVVSTFEWTFALWYINDIVYSRSCVFCATFCFGMFWASFMMFSIQTAATQKETKTWSILGFFRTPCPPPSGWEGWPVSRFWRPPKQWKRHGYWEHISHINVSQPLCPNRIMHNKCDT